MAALPITVLAGYAAGALLARAGRATLATSKAPFSSPPFRAAVVFGAGVLVPLVLGAYILAPDWTLMYFASSAHLPAGLFVLEAAALVLAAVVAGFWATHRLAGERGSGLHLAAAVLAPVAALASGHARLTRVAHYEAFHYGGASLPLVESSLMVGLGLGVPAAVGCFLYVFMTIGAKAAAPPPSAPRAAKSAKTATEVGPRAG